MIVSVDFVGELSKTNSEAGLDPALSLSPFYNRSVSYSMSVIFDETYLMINTQNYPNPKSKDTKGY